MQPTARTALRVLAACAVAVVLVGCSLSPRIVERKLGPSDKVAQVGVAVVAAAPFELFVKDLQPGFDIDGKLALEMATASTRQIEDSYLKAVQAVLKLAPEQLSSERKRSGSTDAAGQTSSTSSTSIVAQAGSLENVTATIPGGALPPVMPASAPQGSVNPMLSHLLATALLQEVKLLNRYVRSAPALKDRIPFIVRIQINVQQFGRNTPYDARVGLDFGDEIVAVPLLVSDSIDITSASVARSQIRSLGVGLAALRGNFALGLDAGSRIEQMLRALGSEFNPVMSVGQNPEKPNSLTVFIGANEKDVDKHELLTRSHLVTVLLLVKPDQAKLKDGALQEPVIDAKLTPRVHFTHARTGEQHATSTVGGTIEFGLSYWPKPRLPGLQRVRLVLEGDEAPYKGRVVLAGGDALVEGMFKAVCLRDKEDNAGKEEKRCERGDAVLATEIDIDNSRQKLVATFEGLAEAIAAKPKASADTGQSPGFLCFDTNGPYRMIPIGSGTCMRLFVEGPAPKPQKPAPPSLKATVEVAEPRVLADAQGLASVTIAVRTSDIDADQRPEFIELAVAGAGVRRVEVLGGAAGCAVRAAQVAVRGDCSFVLHLANALPANRLKLSAVAVRRFADRKADTRVPLEPSIAALEVVAQATSPSTDPRRGSAAGSSKP